MELVQAQASCGCGNRWYVTVEDGADLDEITVECSACGSDQVYLREIGRVRSAGRDAPQ